MTQLSASSSGQFPLIPKAEYDMRLGRAREEMERAGLDFMILTGERNLRYFAGYDPGAWVIPNYYYVMLIPALTVLPPTLLVAEPYQAGAQMSWVEDVRVWSLGTDSFMSDETPAVKLVTDVVHEHGAHTGTIGVELGASAAPHIGYRHFSSILEGLDGARVVDVVPVVAATRMIKSPFELDLITQAVEITDAALQAGWSAAKPDMSEREIATVIATKALALGATRIDFLCLFTYPARAGWANCPPSDYRIRKGDLVHFDGGFAVDGYQCDIIREASIGEPSPELAKSYEINQKAIEAGIEAIAPGVKAGDVYEAVTGVKRGLGCSAFIDWCEANGLAAVGHGIGLDLHEEPGLLRNAQTPLRPGMVLSIEHWLSVGGAVPPWTSPYRCSLEAQVVVTDTGARILGNNHVGHDLLVV